MRWIRTRGGVGASRGRPRRRLALFVALLVLALAGALLHGRPARTAAITHDCGLPHASPLWIEFGTASVPPEVRAVFARPGVVVSLSGTALAAEYRAKGAGTTYFVLNLPPYVGQPATPADPATVVPEADVLYERAVESTACARPWIALNELLGPGLATPWSAANAQYRANVLALVDRLTARGARPALLVHGDPNVAGDAAAWWVRVSRSAAIVYESYYNARNIHALGPVLGNRRMRLGMRNIVRRFTAAGVPVDRLGFMMGFHVALGTGGREGLGPSPEWFRVVKWEALTARQIAIDERIPTIWSWGWGTFGEASADPDKPAAACVYLWARDAALCDGPAAAGSGFDASLTEGQIVMPARMQCTFAGGTVPTSGVADLQRLTGDRRAALTALFARRVLGRDVRIRRADVLAAETRVIRRVFGGSRAAYVRALVRRKASVEIARGILTDELRRARIARLAAESGTTALLWAAERTAQAADTATCRRDELPGGGDFPRSNALEIDVVPLASWLRFLVGDRTAPGAPGGLAATRTTAGAVVLDWNDGREADHAGYQVLRATTAGGPYTKLNALPLVRSTYTDAAPPAGAAASYVIRALDTSGNVSARSVEAGVGA